MQFSSIFMIFNTLQIIYAINSAILTKNQEKEENLTFFYHYEISDPHLAQPAIT